MTCGQSFVWSVSQLHSDNNIGGWHSIYLYSTYFNLYEEGQPYNVSIFRGCVSSQFPVMYNAVLPQGKTFSSKGKIILVFYLKNELTLGFVWRKKYIKAKKDVFELLDKSYLHFDKFTYLHVVFSQIASNSDDFWWLFLNRLCILLT